MRQVVVKIPARQVLRRGKVKEKSRARVTGNLRKVSKGKFVGKEMPKETPKDEEDEVLWDGEGTEKDVTEYIVIQRRVWYGAEEPWQVWGTTEETDIESLGI